VAAAARRIQAVGVVGVAAAWAPARTHPPPLEVPVAIQLVEPPARLQWAETSEAVVVPLAETPATQGQRRTGAALAGLVAAVLPPILAEPVGRLQWGRPVVAEAGPRMPVPTQRALAGRLGLQVIRRVQQEVTVLRAAPPAIQAHQATMLTSTTERRAEAVAEVLAAPPDALAELAAREAWAVAAGAVVVRQAAERRPPRAREAMVESLSSS
jgi:hypothetical protein